MAGAQRRDQGGHGPAPLRAGDLAAARRLRSSYCMLAHGKVLADRFMDADDVRARRARPGGGRARRGRRRDDGRSPRRSPTTRRRSRRPTSTACATLGLADAEILGVVLAAAARCFFSKVLDGLGAQPDERFAAIEPALRRDAHRGAADRSQGLALQQRPQRRRPGRTRRPRSARARSARRSRRRRSARGRTGRAAGRSRCATRGSARSPTARRTAGAPQRGVEAGSAATRWSASSASPQPRARSAIHSSVISDSSGSR